MKLHETLAAQAIGDREQFGFWWDAAEGWVCTIQTVSQQTELFSDGSSLYYWRGEKDGEWFINTPEETRQEFDDIAKALAGGGDV